MFLVNSPIVRGDNLRFREAGVREVVSRVLLPWLNSFRFFLGQVALLKKTTGHNFRYDAHAPVSNNVMDRWILARCQSLITLVKEEMEAYRLYTIIPRLLELVDELTNWYIRFNRRRLKGEDGKEDTIAALNTLFETLFTLCRTMVSLLVFLQRARVADTIVQSSYTPFLTENIYQTLRTFIPEDPKAGDTRSIHFLLFPEVKAEYFDPVIERQVKRMQTIIELVRNLRERHSISLKVRAEYQTSHLTIYSYIFRPRSRNSLYSTRTKNTWTTSGHYRDIYSRSSTCATSFSPRMSPHLVYDIVPSQTGAFSAENCGKPWLS